MESEWTRKLSKQQLEVIRQDTKEREVKYPSQPQQHIYKDIEQAYKERDRIFK